MGPYDDTVLLCWASSPQRRHAMHDAEEGASSASYDHAEVYVLGITERVHLSQVEYKRFPKEKGVKRLLRSIEVLEGTSEKCMHTAMVVLRRPLFGASCPRITTGTAEYGKVKRSRMK